jgi:type IV pilus assembly protein PilB
MQLSDDNLKRILLSENYITEADLKQSESFAEEHGTSFIEYLMTEGILDKDLLGQAIAESFHVPYSDLNSNQPSVEQVLKIPEEIARKYRVVLFSDTGGATKLKVSSSSGNVPSGMQRLFATSAKSAAIIIATDDPTQENLLSEMQRIFPDQTISITFSLPEDIDIAFGHYKKPLETRFSKIIAGQKHIAPEILEEIFNDALTYHASDIHFEPQAREVIVRFRIDGVLHEAGRFIKPYYENILNRIKVQSGIRIDEHYAAQDGSMRFEKDGGIVDLRTSIVPTVEGEKVVIRVLSSYLSGLALHDLGISPANQIILEESANKPFGMIVVAGPTGSGKTTTLYALLKLLNTPDVNITTIEDPVEYKTPGISQIQVNQYTNLTFAHGLRSIVRQDPDIILVGEIRDKETAEIAVNAALTGHLLLSTFHANDSATAIPRLLDMGVEPFLLSSTLDMVVAQRLARKICDKCKHSTFVKTNDIIAKNRKLAAFFNKDEEITLYQGKGCENCGNTGYKGRSAIFEFIKITPLLQELILKNPSSQEIWKVAREGGALTLFEDGLDKVKSGVTTLDELLRVAEPPEQM